MNLPFSHDQFLDLFGAYNTALWPAVLLIWLVTLVAAIAVLRGRLSRRRLLALLSLHWAWSGVVYHWLFFRRINPAAVLFAALFVGQAVLFCWLASRAGGAVRLRAGWRFAAGVALTGYGLAYPFLGLVLGLTYPRMPAFAVPCPTTLVTAGLLLAVVDIPRLAGVVPILWAIVGSSAAFALGIRADLALAVSAVLLAADLVRRERVAAARQAV
jgi:hypothetical protein